MVGLVPIALNPNAEIREERISDDDSCVIVDDFLADPHGLVDWAVTHAKEFHQPRDIGYPGLVLRFDASVPRDLHRFILSRLGRRFGFLRGDAKLSTGLTMTTRQPAKLANFQRLCHTDPRIREGTLHFASLVYLFSDEALGGTAFYRWTRPEIVYKGLELEAEDPARAAAYLAEHSRVFRETPSYMFDSNDLAERLVTVRPRFNRFVFYSGDIPHSGAIRSPELLTDDFTRGRLTLNTFVSVYPK